MTAERALRSELGRLASTGRFLAWSALCSGLLVAGAMEVSWGHDIAVRVVAVVVALLLAVFFAFAIPSLVLWATAHDEHAAPIAVPARYAAPASAPVVAAVPATPAPAVEDDTRRYELTRRLELGRSLTPRVEAEPETVDTWIAGTRATLERLAPGLAPYFAALGNRPELADDPGRRLAAHLSRLETIVRDSL